MTARVHQIRPTELIDLTQIRFFHDRSSRDDACGIELDPAHFGKIDLGLVPIGRGPVRPITDEQRSVGQLDDRMNLLETRHLRDPSKLGLSGQVDEVVLVAEGQRAVARTHSIPNVRWVLRVIRSAGDQQFLPAWAVHFQLEIGVADRLLGERVFVVGRRLFPFFLEEERWSRRRRRHDGSGDGAARRIGHLYRLERRRIGGHSACAGSIVIGAENERNEVCRRVRRQRSGHAGRHRRFDLLEKISDGLVFPVSDELRARKLRSSAAAQGGPVTPGARVRVKLLPGRNLRRRKTPSSTDRPACAETVYGAAAIAAPTANIANVMRFMTGILAQARPALLIKGKLPSEVRRGGCAAQVQSKSAQTGWFQSRNLQSFA